MTDYGIRLKIKDKIGIVTLDRPDRLNAFNETMFGELAKVTAKLKKDLPRAIVITGSGMKAFSAGFDVNPDNPQISGLMKAVEKHDDTPVKNMLQNLRDVVDGFVSLPVPLIAAVNGKAYGGGAELATRCDMRVMDPEAEFCFSELKLGLMPDWGGGATLVHLIGPSNATDLILTARKIFADESLNLGLVNKICQPGGALVEAIQIAETISQNGPRATRFSLEMIRESRNLSLNASLKLELDKAVSLVASGECIHGISAFLTKQKPDFPDI